MTERKSMDTDQVSVTISERKTASGQSWIRIDVTTFKDEAGQPYQLYDLTDVPDVDEIFKGSADSDEVAGRTHKRVVLGVPF